ncbi:C-type lectin domain family 4 member F-like isoform X2 [Homarus americanus]|uniref:C-type lectin domain family 4 member F-like isoform X2 n=1 Tax=Homarus americanus TaxID=6706 RepID=UPI001C454E95|nr:C-type lectin domain family 4 member F-like isoform X2 [Homarus americanus]
MARVWAALLPGALLAVFWGSTEAEISPLADDLTCPGELTTVLREIKDVLASADGSCAGNTRRQIFGSQTEAMTQVLQQHSEVVRSLLAQTESLKETLTSVTGAQSAQNHLLLALKTELETEKQTKRAQRRTIQDLRMEFHTLREESQTWRNHLRRMEVEVKAGLQKSEVAAQEVTIEVKGATDRTNSLGKVIRSIQRSLQGLEQTVSRHTAGLTTLRRTVGRRPQLSPDTTSSSPPTDAPQGKTVDCPHPYARIGLGCFTVHSTQQLSWQQARDHCRGIDGDLANPFDLYDIVLFLDDSFPGGWGFWIGGTLDTNGTWQWVSGIPVGTQVDFWGRGEPGDALGNDERCLFLHGWWRFRAGADPCTSEKYFICEKKIDL